MNSIFPIRAEASRDVAGRLRTRWVGTHTHGGFFRATAHALVTCAVPRVLVAGLDPTSASSLIGGGIHAATQMAGRIAKGVNAETGSPGTIYIVDKLLKGGTAGGTDVQAEAGHILANAIATRVHEFVANVSAMKTKTTEAVDAARKAAAETAIYPALATLIGAFIASASAAIAGRLRDQHILYRAVHASL